MAVPAAMHEMSEAELRVKALEEGADGPAEQLLLMVRRDHARWLLQKLATETPNE